MTIVGSGGVDVESTDVLVTFKRDFKKLAPDMKIKTKAKLRDLLTHPRPNGLRFEKLKGVKNPSIYTIHVTGNYKISFEINGTVVILRRVANHGKIDRAP